MKAFRWILLSFIVVLFSCSGETVKSDHFVKRKIKLSSAKVLAIGPFHVRTHLPYARYNYEDQLEFHLNQRKYKVIPVRELENYFAEKKLKWGEFLKEREIKKLGYDKSFDLFVQGSIYEEDRSIFDEGNHVIVHIHFFNAQGEKLSTTRFIYSGNRSLVSGELIDESLEAMLDKFENE